MNLCEYGDKYVCSSFFFYIYRQIDFEYYIDDEMTFCTQNKNIDFL